MPFEHIIYIPAVLLIGLWLGYSLGARAAHKHLERHRDRAKD